MRAGTITIVTLGLALALVLGFSQGFDTTSITILVLIAVVGALAIAATNPSKREAVEPAVCTECGGLISPNAPYCKHCGERQRAMRRSTPH